MRCGWDLEKGGVALGIRELDRAAKCKVETYALTKNTGLYCSKGSGRLLVGQQSLRVIELREDHVIFRLPRLQA